MAFDRFEPFDPHWGGSSNPPESTSHRLELAHPDHDCSLINPNSSRTRIYPRVPRQTLELSANLGALLSRHGLKASRRAPFFIL